LVEQEEEQGEAISLFSPMKRFLRDIEKLVGLNLPKENIRGFSQILMLPRTNQTRTRKTTTRFNSAKPKQTLQTEAVTVLVQDVESK
jgi:hypothetical protein